VLRGGGNRRKGFQSSLSVIQKNVRNQKEGRRNWKEGNSGFDLSPELKKRMRPKRLLVLEAELEIIREMCGGGGVPLSLCLGEGGRSFWAEALD